MNEQDFYIGYSPRAPHRLSHYLQRVSATLIVVAAALAIVVSGAQGRFDVSRFEFGIERDFSGVLRKQPVPVLLTPSPLLLVAPGKHGFVPPGGLNDDDAIRVRGSLIEHGASRMLEVLVEPMKSGSRSELATAHRVIGPIALRGEVVDTKCYLGVMNPGRGKVHRDCAVRCISGGIPPGLLVRDRNGRSATLLLTGVQSADLLPFVAEPVRVTGSLERFDGVYVLRMTAQQIRRE
jgi:hypothetical protein